MNAFIFILFLCGLIFSTKLKTEVKRTRIKTEQEMRNVRDLILGYFFMPQSLIGFKTEKSQPLPDSSSNLPPLKGTIFS